MKRRDLGVTFMKTVKKSAEMEHFMNTVRQLDTVGVAGSIPAARTIRNKPKTSKSSGIREKSEELLGVFWRNDRPSFYRATSIKTAKRCDKGVTSRRVKKRA